MTRPDLDGAVALVTGGARGIGAAVCRRLAAGGASVVVADVDAEGGRSVAEDTGGRFVACDVTHLDDVVAAVAEAEAAFGRLDLVHLNAGVTTGCGLGEDFDPVRYRRAMAVNLDGVVFGVHAALPALLRRGGGRIVATASLAGLVAVPGEPVYAANKHAVVGLVRSIGPSLAEQGVVVNALCPGFADTDIVSPEMRDVLESIELPLLGVETVVDAFMAVIERGEPGECWFVQVGRAPEPFRFPRVPGPRVGDGSSDGADQ